MSTSRMLHYERLLATKNPVSAGARAETTAEQPVDGPDSPLVVPKW